MRVIDKTWFPHYYEQVGKDIPVWFEAYGFAGASTDLTYLINASAVYSSNIEGNMVDLNSFMNSLTAKSKFKPGKEVEEIKDLVKGYEFAKQHEITEKNFFFVHKTMSRTLLIKGKQGKYRNDRMGVFDHTGLVYMAIEPEKVEAEMKQLFEDIAALLSSNLNIEEAFYHASLLHLSLAHIHPFWDGNGRMARLLEKWFLSSIINSRSWALQPERHYKEHQPEYYQNINLGVNYYELDYGSCLPFLAMLPMCLK